MEILTANRQITIDSLDLLDQEEENVLFGVEDPARQEQIRQDFAARRAAVTTPEQFSFTLGPMDFINQMQAVDFARECGLWDGKSQLSQYSLSLLLLMHRITAWSGFEAAGEALPCTPANKILVFGQAFTVIQALQSKLAALEAAEAKNSGTSAAG